VRGFVGKTRWRLLETQGHQEMLVAEGVKESDLADGFREQLHRDRVGFEALHILGQVVKIEADVSRLSRNAGVLQSDAVCVVEWTLLLSRFGCFAVAQLELLDPPIDSPQNDEQMKLLLDRVDAGLELDPFPAWGLSRYA
jgi:hypothetical protein